MTAPQKPPLAATKESRITLAEPRAPRPAAQAKPRKRHMSIMLSFWLAVVAPLAVACSYLYLIADDQYVSRVGFAVRSEELSSAIDLLGGLSSLSGSSSSDTDILYEFIQSQQLVERTNERIDLTEVYTRPEFDPIFAFGPTGDIEDLVEYWQRVVRVYYDQGTNLVEVHVRAFRPEDAQLIAEIVVDESSQLINRLSAIARTDATRYARADLQMALDRLKAARQAMTQFRSETRIIDPTADLEGQMGLLTSLEAQLASAQIDLNLLQETARESDPRIRQAQRRIQVIRGLIEQERAQFSNKTRNTNGDDFTTLVGEFERLTVDLEYAQTAYLAAQAALDTSIAEAQRQSRYLATYNSPTLPQSSRYPERLTLSIIIAGCLFLAWSMGILVYYSVRDRR
ncbi:MAG: sugar transporter [Paracoccaceae bacterium]